jgi:hypothetical protein
LNDLLCCLAVGEFHLLAVHERGVHAKVLHGLADSTSRNARGSSRLMISRLIRSSAWFLKHPQIT